MNFHGKNVTPNKPISVPVPRGGVTDPVPTTLTPIDGLDSAPAMSVEEALAERDRLTRKFDELKGAHLSRRTRSREREAEVINARHALREALDRAALERPGESLADDPEVAGLRRTILEFEAEERENRENREARKRAERKVALELHVLHLQQWAAFEEHAEAAGAEALEAIQDMEAAYRRAQDAWGRCKREWDRLTHHRNEARQAPLEGDPSRDLPPHLEPVAECPLPDYDALVRATPPRPAEWQPTPFQNPRNVHVVAAR